MAKIKIAYRGKVLKRSLLTQSAVIERAEYVDPLSASEEMEMVRYNVGTILLHGVVTRIEKPVGTKLWYRSTEE